MVHLTSITHNCHNHSRAECCYFAVHFPAGAKYSHVKCLLCSNEGTLEHILNFCPVATDQGRTTVYLNMLEHPLFKINQNTWKYTLTCWAPVLTGKPSRKFFWLFQVLGPSLTWYGSTDATKWTLRTRYWQCIQKEILEIYTPLKTGLGLCFKYFLYHLKVVLVAISRKKQKKSHTSGC